MNAVNDGVKEEQLKTIYRLCHWSELNSFKSVQSTVVNSHFVFANKAIQEEQKFFKYIKNNACTPEMETMRVNLLKTVSCEMDLEASTRNYTDVLSSIFRCNQCLFPAKSKALEVCYNISESQQSANGNIELPPTTNVGTQSGVDEEEEKRIITDAQMRVENERIIKLRKDADRHVSESSISSLQMP